jgi:hypothetical protein
MPAAQLVWHRSQLVAAAAVLLHDVLEHVHL